MKQSLKDILNRIDGIVVGGSKLFKHSAVYNDQVRGLLTGKSYSYSTPACFVEVLDYSDEQLGMGIAAQDVYVNFHIIHTQLDAADGTLDQNFDVFDLRNAIRKYMTGFNPCDMTSFGFATERQDFRHNNVYHFIVTFKSKYFDYNGDPRQNGFYTTYVAGTWAVDRDVKYVPTLEDSGVGVGGIGVAVGNNPFYVG